MTIKILIAQLIFHLSRILRIGSGYTYSGHVLLKLDPQILKYFLDQLKEGVILISGTNGKTTTTKIIAEVLSKNGHKVITNSSGANLLNGITSALALSASVNGKLTFDIGVLEVDEFVLPGLLKIISPKVLVLLNLSRDQLDRYGETDTILERWTDLLNSADFSGTTKVIYDSTQDYFLERFKNKLNYVGFAVRDFGSDLPLKGYYNSKNLSAAYEVCALYKIDLAVFIDSIKDIAHAWGRGEKLQFGTSNFEILLAKNPASFNSNLDLVRDYYFGYENFLVILNDNIPDGRDVSWIYDIDSSKLAATLKNKKLYFAGTRGTEMALRFRYANLNIAEQNVFKTLEHAISALSNKASQNSVIVLPNYSAMLELRKIITGRKVL